MFIVVVSRIDLMLEFLIPAWVSCRIRVCFRFCNVVDLEMQDCEWDLSRWGFALEPEGFAADIRGERIPCKFWSLCFILIDSEFKCRDLSIIFTDPICVKASFDVKHAKSPMNKHTFHFRIWVQASIWHNGKLKSHKMVVKTLSRKRVSVYLGKDDKPCCDMGLVWFNVKSYVRCHIEVNIQYEWF